MVLPQAIAAFLAIWFAATAPAVFFNSAGSVLSLMQRVRPATRTIDVPSNTPRMSHFKYKHGAPMPFTPTPPASDFYGFLEAYTMDPLPSTSFQATSVEPKLTPTESAFATQAGYLAFLFVVVGSGGLALILKLTRVGPAQSAGQIEVSFNSHVLTCLIMIL